MERMSPPCASPTSPRLETAHAAVDLALAPRTSRHGMQHVVRDNGTSTRSANVSCIQLVSHSLEVIDAERPRAAIVTNRVDRTLAQRTIAVRQLRHLALAVRFAMPMRCPRRTQMLMNACTVDDGPRCRPLRRFGLFGAIVNR